MAVWGLPDFSRPRPRPKPAPRRTYRPAPHHPAPPPSHPRGPYRGAHPGIGAGNAARPTSQLKSTLNTPEMRAEYAAALTRKLGPVVIPPLRIPTLSHIDPDHVLSDYTESAYRQRYPDAFYGVSSSEVADVIKHLRLGEKAIPRLRDDGKAALVKSIQRNYNALAAAAGEDTPKVPLGPPNPKGEAARPLEQEEGTPTESELYSKSRKELVQIRNALQGSIAVKVDPSLRGKSVAQARRRAKGGARERVIAAALGAQANEREAAAKKKKGGGGFLGVHLPHIDLPNPFSAIPGGPIGEPSNVETIKKIAGTPLPRFLTDAPGIGGQSPIEQLTGHRPTVGDVALLAGGEAAAAGRLGALGLRGLGPRLAREAKYYGYRGAAAAAAAEGGVLGKQASRKEIAATAARQAMKQPGSPDPVGKVAAQALGAESGSLAQGVLRLTGAGAKRGVDRGKDVGARALSAPFLPATTGVSTDQGVRNLSTAPFQIGRAFLDAPGPTSVASLASLRDAIVGFPAAIYTIATDPQAGFEALKTDYSERYGPLLEGDTAAFRRQVQEKGATPFVLDALILAPPAGRIAGGLARRGGLGRQLQELSTAPRRRLRISAAEAVDQRLSPNLIMAAAQKALDFERASHEDRVIAKRGEHGPAIRSAEGEVVHLTRSGQNRALRKDVSGRKARQRERLLAEQAEEIGRTGMRREIASLSRKERRGLKYAIQLGVRDPKAAVAHLKKRVNDIRANRELEGYDAPKRLDEIRHMEYAIEHADEIFTPKLGHVADLQVERGARLAVGDPGVGLEQARVRSIAQQAEHLGVGRREGEAVEDFVGRVRAEARAQGLHGDAGYFPSQIPNRERFAQHTVGGTHAVTEPGRYTGRNFRAGVEDPSPRVLEEGLASNIKRKYNWNLVAETFDRHTFDWSRNKSVRELLDEAARRGIDLNKVAFWNPHKFRTVRAEAEGSVTADPTHSTELSDTAHVQDALNASSSKSAAATLATHPEDFQGTKGWSLVPRTVYDEVHANASAGPVQGAGRAFDIAKTKQARILLGAANISWLQFQVASNALLTGLAGTGIGDIGKSIFWWHKLPPEVKKALDPYIGTGSFQGDIRQVKMGAAANNELINAYRGMKATVAGTSIWPTGDRVRVGDLNPLDVMFRADHAQNNFFRRSVLYSQLKRDAYRRMGENASAIGNLQNRMVGFLSLGPREQMLRLADEVPTLERHAKTVNDFLGDYMTYTAKERATLGRYVMFYGFLRFSLRFAFQTMPLKHPIMTGILGNLSRMKVEEVRKLLGGNELPYALGRIYDDGGEVALDFTRGNPFSNALTSTTSLGQVAGLFPPLVVGLVEQAAKKDFFTGKPYLVEGENQPRKYLEIPVEDRLRIFANKALSLFNPYREAQTVTTRAIPQGADSLLWDQRPTRYKDPEILADMAKQRAEQPDIFTQVLQDTFPFAPALGLLPKKVSNDKTIAEGIREARAEELKRLKGTGSSRGSSNPYSSIGKSSTNPYSVIK